MSINNKKEPKYLTYTLFVLVFVCLLINIFRISNLKAPGLFDSDTGQILNTKFDIYIEGELIDNSTLPYSFSQPIRSKQIELVTTLPSDEFVNNSFISFRSSGYSVKVDVADSEIYSFYVEGSNNYGGAYWNFVKLPDNSSSKEMIIRLTCPSSGPFSNNIFPIYIGDKGYLLVESFHSGIESLFFGIILIVFGLVFLGNIVFFNRSVGNKYLLSLSLILICFGTWVLTQSSSKQLLGITNPAFPMEFSFFAIFCLPLCIWFYVSNNYHGFKDYKILKYSSYIIFFLYIPVFLTSFFGIPYTNFLATVGSLLLLYTLLVFLISIKLYRNGEKTVISCLIAILSILLSVLAEEGLLLLKINIGHVSILHAGMALAAIIFIYKSIGNLIEKNTEDHEAKLLKKLAYLDVVTLVQNRNSYERFIEENNDLIKSTGIILADINCLKMVNDRDGHKSGDELLKRLSKDLREALPPESKIYRVGGDEFVGIIDTFSKEDFIKFSENLIAKFAPQENALGMSIGAHYYVKSEDINLLLGIEKADKKMYLNKEKQKDTINSYFVNKDFSKDLSLPRNNNSYLR